MIATKKDLLDITEHIVRKVSSMEVPKTELFAEVSRDIKNMIDREFGLHERDLDNKYLYDVHKFIDCYKLPLYLWEKVETSRKS